MAEFFVDAVGAAHSDSWERDLKISSPRLHATFDVKVFFNDEHTVPQLRIDVIHVDGLFDIEVGGGPESHVDCPTATMCGGISRADIQTALEELVGRFQSAKVTLDFGEPLHWWNAPEHTDDEDDEDEDWF